MKPVIDFKGYQINEIIYEKREKLIDVNELKREGNNLSSSVSISTTEDMKRAKITIETTVYDNRKEDSGNVFVSMDGYFEINEGFDDYDIQEFLSTNGVAILYPYVRMVVSSVSSLNAEDSIILPTINTSLEE